ARDRLIDLLAATQCSRAPAVVAVTRVGPCNRVSSHWEGGGGACRDSWIARRHIGRAAAGVRAPLYRPGYILRSSLGLLASLDQSVLAVDRRCERHRLAVGRRILVGSNDRACSRLTDNLAAAQRARAALVIRVARVHGGHRVRPLGQRRDAARS